MEEKMKKHVTVVAAIQIGFALLGFLAALGAFFLLSVAQTAVGDVEEVAEYVLRFLATSVPLLIGLLSTLGMVGGIGLFWYKQWARYIVIVVASFGLLNIPVGTLKGIYFLWVLFQSDTIKLFEKHEAEPATSSPDL